MQDGAGTSSTPPATPTGRALEHGGRLEAARRRFPLAPEPFIDLSTGINPVPYPMPDLPPEAWSRLPEPETLDALQRAAAVRYGASDPAMVVATPGTQILISLLPLLLPQMQVTVLSPAYGEHAAAWRHAGADVLETTRFEDLRGASCAVLCNPNNPDGRRVPAAALLALAGELTARRGLLMVDEAFADFEEGLSLAPHLPARSVLLRSFGKAYGLAGLRLGFALAEPGLAARLRAALGPWAVSGPAAAIGTRALLDLAWTRQAGARLCRDAARLDALLGTAGLSVVGGTTLFRLAAGEHVPSLFARLGEAGILVRRFTAHPNWLRFGLPGSDAAWARLEAVLEQRAIR